MQQDRAFPIGPDRSMRADLMSSDKGSSEIAISIGQSRSASSTDKSPAERYDSFSAPFTASLSSSHMWARTSAHVISSRGLLSTEASRRALDQFRIVSTPIRRTACPAELTLLLSAMPAEFAY